MQAAASSIESFHRDTDELAAQLAAGDPRHALLDRSSGVNAFVQLIGGSSQAAYTNAVKQIDSAQAVETVVRSPAGYLKNNILRGNLDTAAKAGIRTARYSEAEAFAKQLQDLPSNATDERDPRERRSHAQAIRAHAIAMQGRSDEALEVLAPALEYYRGEAKDGAGSTWFRHEFAYALVVSAIARTGKPAERAQRNADLDEAARVLDGASAEAKRIASFRELANLIASARG